MSGKRICAGGKILCLLVLAIAFGLVAAPPVAAEREGLYLGRYYYPPGSINAAVDTLARQVPGAWYVLPDGEHYVAYRDYRGPGTMSGLALGDTNPLFAVYLDAGDNTRKIYTNPVATVITDAGRPTGVLLLGWPEKPFSSVGTGDFTLRDRSGRTITALATVDPGANLVTLQLTAPLTAGQDYRLEYKGQATGKGVTLPATNPVVTSVAATNLTNLRVCFDQPLVTAGPADFTIRNTTDPAAPAVRVTGVTLAADRRSVVLTTEMRQSTAAYELFFRAGESQPATATPVPPVQPHLAVITGVTVVSPTSLKVTFAEPLAVTPEATDFAIYSPNDRVYVLGQPVLFGDAKTVSIATTPHISSSYTLSYRQGVGFAYTGPVTGTCRISAVRAAGLSLLFSTAQNVSESSFTLTQAGRQVILPGPASNPPAFNTYTYNLNTGLLEQDTAYTLTYRTNAGATEVLAFTGGGKPATITGAISTGTTTVKVTFDQGLTRIPAPAEFVLSPLLSVRTVRLDAGDPRVVYLTTDPQTVNMYYTITCKGVTPASPVVFTGGGEPAVTQLINVAEVSNTSIRVTFDRLVAAAYPSDFTIEPALNIRQVVLATHPLDPGVSVATLITAPQQPGTVYRLTYRGDTRNTREFTGSAVPACQITRVTRSARLGEFFITTDRTVTQETINALRFSYLNTATNQREMGLVQADPDPNGVSGKAWRVRFIFRTETAPSTKTHPVANTAYALVDNATLVLMSHPVLCWTGTAITKITEDLDVGKVFFETSPPVALGTLQTAVTMSGRMVNWLATGAGTARSELYIAMLDPLPEKGPTYTFNIGDGFYIDPYSDLTTMVDPLEKDQYVSWPNPTVKVTPDPAGLDLQVGSTAVITLQAEKNNTPYPGNVRYEITNPVTETATARLEGTNKIRVQALKVGGYKLTVTGMATGETIIPIAIPINVFDVIPPAVTAVFLNDGAPDDELGKDDSVKIDFNKPIDPVSIGLPADDPNADPQTLTDITEAADTFANYLGRIGSFAVNTLQGNDNGRSTIKLTANRKSVIITATGSLSTSDARERLAGPFTPNPAVTDRYGNSVRLPDPANPVPVTGSIDRKPPEALSVNIAYHSGRPAYKIGDQVPVTVTFSENVLVAEPAATQLNLVNIPTVANLTTGAGTRNLVFTYTVQEGDSILDVTKNLVAHAFIASSTITDESGNTLASLALDTLAPPVVDVKIDGGRPGVTASSRIIKNTDHVTAVQADENGTLYLIRRGLTILTQSDAEGAVNSGDGRKAEVTKNTNTTILTSNLPDGEYTIYAVDQAGNVSRIQSGLVITIDTTPPVPLIKAAATTGGDGWVNIQEKADGFTVTVSINEPGTLYLMPAGSYNTITDLTNNVKMTATLAAAGETTITVAGNSDFITKENSPFSIYAVDLAGNISLPVETFRVDLTAPTAGLGAGQEQVTIGNPVQATSNETGWLYLVSATANPATHADLETLRTMGQAGRVQVPVAGTAAVPTTGLASGGYRVYAVDPAGNLSAPIPAATDVITLKSGEKAIISTTIGNLSGQKIINVPADTKVGALKDAIKVSPLATRDILTVAGGAAADPAAVVTAVMVVKVTAEDGTSSEYTIELE